MAATENAELELALAGRSTTMDRTPWLMDDGEQADRIWITLNGNRSKDESRATADALLAALFRETRDLLDPDDRPSNRPCGRVLGPDSYDVIVREGARQERITIEDMHQRLWTAIQQRDRTAYTRAMGEARDSRDRLECLTADVRPIVPDDPGGRARLDQAEAERTAQSGRAFLEALSPVGQPSRTAANLVQHREEAMGRKARGILSSMPEHDRRRALAHAGELAAVGAGIQEEPSRTMAALQASSMLKRALT